jgi:hypothetical protein
MPIDASIPLQVHSLKIPTAMEVMSLRDLATRSQINEQNLQEKQMEVKKRNNLLQITQSPGFSDPNSGTPTPQGIAAYTRIDPEGGIKLSQMAQQMNIQNMAIDEKRTAVKRNILTGYVDSYQRNLQLTGDKVQAEKQAREEAMASIQEGKKSGHFAAQGFSANELEHELPPPDVARTAVLAMGGKVSEPPLPQHIVASTKDTSTGLGFYDSKTKQFLQDAEGKVIAAPPTLQATMANVQIPQSDKEFWADVIRKGGSLPPGLARSGVGAKLVSEVMQEVPKTGIKPNEMLANQAEFVGEKAGQRTLGTRTANIEMAATEARGLADLARTASDEWNRSDIRSFNDLQRIAQDKTKSPELRRAVGATTSFINAYARAINPQGVGTVADKEHAMQMISPAFAKGDYAAAIDQLIKEIETAQKSPGKVKENMRNRFLGKQEETAQNKAPQGALDYLQAHPESKDHFKAKYGYLP